MKKKNIILTLIVASLASHMSAQRLLMRPVTANVGEQAEIVVYADDLGTNITALQFNLSLPEGVALNEAAVTKNSTVSGHELSVSTLDGGDRLFVLYDMNLRTISNGVLLRLPITIGSEAFIGNARLSKVRFATTEAVSLAAADTNGLVTAIQLVDAEGNLNVGSARAATYTLDGQRTTDKPTRKGIYIRDGKKMVVK